MHAACKYNTGRGKQEEKERNGDGDNESTNAGRASLGTKSAMLSYVGLASTPPRFIHTRCHDHTAAVETIHTSYCVQCRDRYRAPVKPAPTA